MDEFDSIGEVLFYLANVGVIILGFYFIFKAKLLRNKIVLSFPMLFLHCIVLPINWFGCSLDVFGSTFCREFFWIYIIFPPIIFAVGLLELVIFEVIRRKYA